MALPIWYNFCFSQKENQIFFQKNNKISWGHSYFCKFIAAAEFSSFSFFFVYLEIQFFSYVIIKFRKIYLHDWLVWMYKTVLANLIPYYFFSFFSILPGFSCFMPIYACFASLASTHQFSLWAQHLKGNKKYFYRVSHCKIYFFSTQHYNLLWVYFELPYFFIYLVSAKKFENVANSNSSSRNISIFWLIIWFFSVEAIQGRKLWPSPPGTLHV